MPLRLLFVAGLALLAGPLACKGGSTSAGKAAKAAVTSKAPLKPALADAAGLELVPEAALFVAADHPG